jgi:hypothetical protein
MCAVLPTLGDTWLFNNLVMEANSLSFKANIVRIRCFLPIR